MPLHIVNFANLAPLKSNPSQPDQDNIRFTFALGLILATNNNNIIIKNAFTIYRTALALGMSLFKLNSFYNIKFQDKTLAIKK